MELRPICQEVDCPYLDSEFVTELRTSVSKTNEIHALLFGSSMSEVGMVDEVRQFRRMMSGITRLVWIFIGAAASVGVGLILQACF
jgi:hypothetical protein